MNELKKQLKDMTEDMPLLFQRLKMLLLSDSTAYNTVLLQESRYREANTKWINGLQSKEDTDLTINQVRQALLLLIDDLETGDLKPSERPDASALAPKVLLHDYHRYTCNRVEHSDAFAIAFGKNRTQRKHFFFLYGLDLQSHRGLFYRIAYDLEGRLADYLNPELQKQCKSLTIELGFDVSHDPQVYKQNILKNLFFSLDVPVNESAPLTEKNLNWLLSRSPKVSGLAPSDFLCVFVAISEYDWDPDITPEVTRWFITSFCEAKLKDEFPTVLFFFAIIYEEDDSPVESEVRAMVRSSELVTGLPELNMVAKKDVARWFSKYSFIAPTHTRLKAIRDQHFGQAQEFYMEDVELKLKKLIDAYNLGVLS